VLLIAAIIAAHGLASYAAVEVWSYADVREVTLSPITEGALFALLAPFGLFMIPLLFLISGLFTPPSVERKGPGRFARDRLMRLGIPFAIFVGLIWPVTLYALYRPLGNAPGSYWREFIGTAEESLDMGYFWFVGDLLLFSLGYAVWVALRGQGREVRHRAELSVGRLLILAAVVSLATFLVRLGFAFESELYLDLNLYEWPAAIALFGLGLTAWRRGWLEEIPARLHAQCRKVSLLVVGGFGVFIAVGFAFGGVGEETWKGGWHWDAVAFQPRIHPGRVRIVYAAVAQRRLNRNFRWRPSIARCLPSCPGRPDRSRGGVAPAASPSRGQGPDRDGGRGRWLIWAGMVADQTGSGGGSGGVRRRPRPGVLRSQDDDPSSDRASRPGPLINRLPIRRELLDAMLATTLGPHPVRLETP
jgi:hypothetical protein